MRPSVQTPASCLENRLASATTVKIVDTDEIVTLVEYTYNQAGIRVKAEETVFVNAEITSEETKLFLIDSYNHTGYAQVLEEFDGVSATPVMSYVIGDDVLSQATSADVSHFLYDGHGSTRQLADSQASITAQYSFDAYGHMLGTQAGATPQQETSLLYSGEYFDTSLQNYYLRARWYNQNNGRFNRVDPFGGSNYDPQSLHKYAYAHNEPINNVDPSGNFTLIELAVVVVIVALVLALLVVSHGLSPNSVNDRIARDYFSGRSLLGLKFYNRARELDSSLLQIDSSTQNLWENVVDKVEDETSYKDAISSIKGYLGSDVVAIGPTGGFTYSDLFNDTSRLGTHITLGLPESELFLALKKVIVTYSWRPKLGASGVFIVQPFIEDRYDIPKIPAFKRMQDSGALAIFPIKIRMPELELSP